MSFLPESYKAPTSSNNYMKFEAGDNRIRIMSKPILGWEDWKDNKPVRYRMEDKPLKSFDESKPMRHFWAMIVFNVLAEEIQILHITQTSIRKAIEGLAKDKDWGAPFSYDIKIHKSGEKMDTEYVINPAPHRAIDEFLVEEFHKKPCNLEALFDGLDPFAAGHLSYTPIGIDVSESVTVAPVAPVAPVSSKKYITEEQALEVEAKLELCTDAYKKQLASAFKKLQVSDIRHLTPEIHEQVLHALEQNKK